MQPIPVSHLYDLSVFSEKHWNNIFAEFAENGAKYMALTSLLSAKLLSEPALLKNLQLLSEKYNIYYLEAHAPWGGWWDLNSDDPNRRPILVEQHKLCIKILSTLGVKTYTMHIGAQNCYENAWFGYEEHYRALAKQTLEALLPTADKEKVVIAIENSFEPSNAPEEILYYLQQINSPALGCCFDAGHASFMDADQPRTQEQCWEYARVHAWHNQMKFVPFFSALQTLAPWIVTTHLHDNNACNDDHHLIFNGVIDWKRYMSILRKCPRLVGIQNEADMVSQAIPIAKACRAFEQLLLLYRYGNER